MTGIIDNTGKVRVASNDIERQGVPNEVTRWNIHNASNKVKGMWSNGGGLSECNSTRAMVSQRQEGTLVYIPTTATVAGIAAPIANTPTSVTLSNVQKVGLYSSDGTNLSLLSTCSDLGTGFWSFNVSGGSWCQWMFDSPVTVQPGIYWASILASWSALSGSSNFFSGPTLRAVAQGLPLYSGSALRYWTLASQTDMQSTIAWSSVTGSTNSIALLPIG